MKRNRDRDLGEVPTIAEATALQETAVEAPPPTRSNRDVLPMSTGVPKTIITLVGRLFRRRASRETKPPS